MDIFTSTIDWTSNPLALTTFGVAGGSLVALLLLRLNRRTDHGGVAAPLHTEPITIGHINMAHIRVAGVGGLALVAMCAAVAIVIPAVGISLLAGAVAGTGGAMWLIARRRHTGPLASSGERMGANTTLRIDD